MKQRQLGTTGLRVSELGFGCGMVGGLVPYGEYPTIRRTVARAIELGVTYFDTAPMYGDGQSEVNLGAVLRELRASVVVGTKVRLSPAELPRIADAVPASVEASLRRLGTERIDLIQLHNLIAPHGVVTPGWIGPDQLPEVFRAFEALARQGKTRCWGITALGDTQALQHAVASGGFHTIQTVFNLLNPSAGRPVSADFPYQDFRQLIDRAAARGMGTIAIRTMAGGALSGSTERHPLATSAVGPLATGETYAADAEAARRFEGLLHDGIVGNLPEAAIRFAISKPELSVAMIGISSPEQLEAAVAAVNRGPLPADVLARL
jgi:L-galactose dehydrogenase/L-glyceraldehyde 3-phosphate reductase